MAWEVLVRTRQSFFRSRELRGNPKDSTCTAPATSSYPSLKNSFNGCQGHPTLCLPPRTAQGIPDRIQMMFGRAVFIQLAV
jgi:hypothetical protein